MKSRSNLFLLAVVVLTGLSIWGYLKKDFAKGIDIQGGIRLVYSVEQTEESIEKGRSLDQDRASTIRTLLRRTSDIGVVESAVYSKGIDQIVVELPGYTDIEEAKKLMGSTARLYCYFATNITTYETNGATRRTRRYRTGDEDLIQGMPVVWFTKTVGGGDPIKYGDPEYQRILDDWVLILEGSDLSDARPRIRGDGSVVPEFFFSTEGARKMEAWSRSVLNQHENLAFVIDGRVLSIAPVQENVILTDGAFIEGQFDPAAVKRLTTLLREGALDVELNQESEQTIDASIGAGALDQIVVAGGVSFGLICLFLIFYYSVPGFIAAIAMCLYGLFTLTALKWLGATFSLAAIAAFVLSVGMAVDANVLVFERIKEELRAGRQLMTAVDLGFKRALSAIVDSNACTLLTCLVLFWLGTGPVKGFATTLIWGVLISFFTAFTVTRSLLTGWIKTKMGSDPKYFALQRNWFGEKMEEAAEGKPINILGGTKKWFTISIVLILSGMAFVVAGGIKPNVEFGGGYEGIYRLTDSNTTRSDISDSLLGNGIEKFNVKLGDAGQGEETFRVAYITVPTDVNLQPDDTDSLRAPLAEAAGLSDENASFTAIGPTIQREMIQNAILGIIIAIGLIILYIAIRFGVALGGMKNGIKFGLSAIAALMHDALFVVGVAGFVGMMMGWEISALFITAMLTVIGFSVHDSIVIFDRIRENLRRPHRNETFEHLVNKSITQSVARSINTSVTAFVPLVILVIWGTTVPEIKFMCVTMAAGIAVGTYSSIFNASPILWLWNKATMRRHGEQAGLMLEAQREAKLRAQIALDTDTRAYRDEEGQTYGQIKRRKSAAEEASRDIDD